MSFGDFIVVVQWCFLAYFCGLSGVYLALNLLAALELRRYLPGRRLDRLGEFPSGLEPPVSILVPAYNEEATIVASVHSLLQLNYPEFEVIVIDDGSADGTLAALREAFALVPYPEAYRVRLATQPVTQILRSARRRDLRVICKANGGKADALNAGVNAARFPLVCSVDADSVLQRDSLINAVRPFLDDRRTVACGGTVRLANGCRVDDGFVAEIGLPRRLLPLIQVVEYVRAFLFGRLGWSRVNALLIVSGAFGVFHKDTVAEVGGYRTVTVGEDMELILRMHRILKDAGRSYRITFVPDPVCWTEAPEDLRTLRNQRVRWQRGLTESLWMNRSLAFDPRAGAVGLLAFPFFLVFECLGPLFEVAGYLLLAAAVVTGDLSLQAFVLFLALVMALGLFLSVTALLLDEAYFGLYRKPGDLARLLLAAIAENAGYRQLITLWRAWGLVRVLQRRRHGWGRMRRSASWSRK